MRIRSKTQRLRPPRGRCRPMANTTANSRAVSSTFIVRRSGKAIVAIRLMLVGLRLELLLNGDQSPFQGGPSLVNCHFPHNAPLESSQPGLFGALQGNQVETGRVRALWVFRA